MMLPVLSSEYFVYHHMQKLAVLPVHITTGVIQMMLPVLSLEYFVYHYMQKLAVVPVYQQLYYVSDDSNITSIIIPPAYEVLGGI